MAGAGDGAAREKVKELEMSETVTVDGVAVDYSGLPEFCRDIVQRYIERGCDPGTGWRFILAADLRAVIACDAEMVAALPQIYRWLVNHAPSLAWGCEQNVRDWRQARWMFVGSRA